MIGLAQKSFSVDQTQLGQILLWGYALLLDKKIIQISVGNIQRSRNLYHGYVTVKIKIHIAFSLLNVSVGMATHAAVVHGEQIEKS